MVGDVFRILVKTHSRTGFPEEDTVEFLRDYWVMAEYVHAVSTTGPPEARAEYLAAVVSLDGGGLGSYAAKFIQGDANALYRAVPALGGALPLSTWTPSEWQHVSLASAHVPIEGTMRIRRSRILISVIA